MGAGRLLRGTARNDRYVTRAEKTSLQQAQAALPQPEATHGALIPYRKSLAWWAPAQDERREIFEETSKHVAIGMKYLPAIARRLHHCRDLGGDASFDFITLFDFAEPDAASFEDLVAALRESPEWTFVEHELDIRMLRAGGTQRPNAGVRRSRQGP
ncbi:MAG: chlorite dismutase family protein [Planctomycetota bacterium]